MSEEDERKLEEAIRDCVGKELSSLFWKLTKWLGIPTMMMAVALTVFYARLSYHVEDHHERLLIQISADVKHMKVDLDAVKKKLNSLNVKEL